MYYLKGAASGGICCSITHGALTPVDVVKTRVQLDPAKVGCFHLIGRMKIKLNGGKRLISIGSGGHPFWLRRKSHLSFNV